MKSPNIEQENKCSKCHKVFEEVIQFGEFGNNEKKCEDKAWYCEKCFSLKEKEYIDLKAVRC